MKLRFFRQHSIAGCGLFLGAAVAAVYAFTCARVYESFAMAAVERLRIELPSSPNEEVKNRWVWVRDGQALQQALLSDDFLLTLLRDPELLRRFESYRAHQLKCRSGAAEDDLRLAFVTELRKAIQVDYTGGDANGYAITVRDRDAATARLVAASTLDHLRDLAVGSAVQAYHLALERLTGRPEAQALQAASLVQEAYARTAFQVLRHPFVALRPVWPRRGLLILIGAFFGLLAGLSLEFWRGERRR